MLICCGKFFHSDMLRICLYAVDNFFIRICLGYDYMLWISFHSDMLRICLHAVDNLFRYDDMLRIYPVHIYAYDISSAYICFYSVDNFSFVLYELYSY